MARRSKGKSSVVAIVKKEIRKHERKVVEKKYFDVTNTYPAGSGGLTSATNGGLRLQLTNPASGTGEEDFVGKQITQKNLNVRFELKANQTSVLSPVRVAIIRLRSYTSTVPSLAEYLENVSTESYAQITPWRRDPAIKYDVLFDRSYVLSALDHTAFKTANVRIKLNDFKQTYNDVQSATVAGSIWMLAFSDESIGTNEPGMALMTRFTFTDQ